MTESTFLILYALVIAAIAGGIYWSWKAGQFDEDIKYLVFTESDKDKMTPEAYAKSRQVLADQIAKRDASQQK